MSAQHTIDTLRKTLRTLVTDWKTDGSAPPNFIRQDGLGNEIARVDVRCGGFQDSRDPLIVGWRALDDSPPHSGSYQSDYDVAAPQDFPSLEATVEYAKARADAALMKFGWDLEPVTSEYEPAPHQGALLADLREEFKHAVLGNEKEQAGYEDLASMASEKGYPALAHALDPEQFPLDAEN